MLIQDIIQYFVTPAHTFILAILYYNLLNGFLNEVAIRRLTKSSFRMGITDLLDLTIAYILASLACVYILFSNMEILKDGSIHIKIFDVLDFIINDVYTKTLILVIVGLLFIGRIITKKKGTFFGRLHFSAIFITCSIYVSYDILNCIITTFHVPELIYINLYNKIDNFINFLNYFLPDLIYGIIFLSFLCEMYLSILSPNNKSLLVVLEKFPSDFKVITGYFGALDYIINKLFGLDKDYFNDKYEYNKLIRNLCCDIKSDFLKRKKNSIWQGDGIYNKLNDILCERKGIKIKKILCITRSIVMADDIIELLIKNKRIRQIDDIKVIISPPYLALRDYDLAINDAPNSLGDFINFKYYKARNYKRDYCKRLIRFNHYIDNYFINTKSYYLGKVVFLIVEFDGEGQKEILFSIRDSGSLMRRVGLHSREPHIVEYYENLFNNIWRRDIPSFKDEFNNIVSNPS